MYNMKLNISKIFRKIVVSSLASSLIFSVSLPTFANTDEIMMDEMEYIDESDIYTSTETEIMITGDLEAFLLSEDIVNESINMTDEQVLDLYEQYTLDNNITEEDFSVENLENFAYYAVAHNIIDDSDIARVGITKSLVRAQFRIFANLGNRAGFKTASQLLRHSLQDNPKKLGFLSSSAVSKRVKQSSECKSIIRDIRSAVKGVEQTDYTTSGSTTLNSTRDLHLAFNKVDYEANGKVVHQIGKRKKWEFRIEFTDTYDFDVQSWNNEMSPNSKAITILNNYAAFAQSLGAIVPYDVSVLVKVTFLSL